MAASGIALQCHNFPSSSSTAKLLTTTKGKRLIPGIKRGEKKMRVVIRAMANSFVAEENKSKTSSREGVERIIEGVGIGPSLVANLPGLALKFLRARISMRSLATEMLLESTIINCRFFMMIPVAGTLIGSILCFVEGCFFVLESYCDYFRVVSQRLNMNQGETIQLIIDAIVMFLVGTAMLTFGIGLYSMFIGPRGIMRRSKRWSMARKLLPGWFEMQTMAQAKSTIGRAVVMLLQASVVEKLKNVPLATGLDLACFAGVVLFSSASMFLLSRLHGGHTQEGLAVE